MLPSGLMWMAPWTCLYLQPRHTFVAALPILDSCCAAVQAVIVTFPAESEGVAVKHSTVALLDGT